MFTKMRNNDADGCGGGVGGSCIFTSGNVFIQKIVGFMTHCESTKHIDERNKLS